LSDLPAQGQFGDQFGAVNSLFSGLAFAGLVYAILLQRGELRLQRRELEQTRRELTRAAEAQDRAQQAMSRQALAAAQSLEIMRRQWQASRVAVVVPIEIALTGAIDAVGGMREELRTALAKELAIFGSVTLVVPELTDAIERSKSISKELFDAIVFAYRHLSAAAELSNRQVGGRRPNEAWREALQALGLAEENLRVAARLSKEAVAWIG
jgi:hypothetical protein